MVSPMKATKRRDEITTETPSSVVVETISWAVSTGAESEATTSSAAARILRRLWLVTGFTWSGAWKTKAFLEEIRQREVDGRDGRVVRTEIHGCEWNLERNVAIAGDEDANVLALAMAHLLSLPACPHFSSSLSYTHSLDLWWIWNNHFFFLSFKVELYLSFWSDAQTIFFVFLVMGRNNIKYGLMLHFRPTVTPTQNRPNHCPTLLSVL